LEIAASDCRELATLLLMPIWTLIMRPPSSRAAPAQGKEETPVRLPPNRPRRYLLTNTTSFRFGACRAYYDLTKRRIVELREERLAGVQTIEEFMDRRLAPARATCASAEKRLLDLSERVARASDLLRTRVDIEREQQNQMLLASMNHRTRMQLRLQQTVEGLSIAAITYYVAGLVGYAAKALKEAGVPLSVELTTGMSIPFVAVAIWLAARRVRRQATAEAEAGAVR
jgi:uncharacterized membrane-anchored protein